MNGSSTKGGHSASVMELQNLVTIIYYALIVQPTTFQSLIPAWLAVLGSGLSAVPLLRNSIFPATRMRNV